MACRHANGLWAAGDHDLAWPPAQILADFSRQIRSVEHQIRYGVWVTVVDVVTGAPIGGGGVATSDVVSVVEDPCDGAS
jgi:hypothetical protein